MEVEFLSRSSPPKRDGAQQVYALHGPDASLELSMLRAVMQLREDALPVLPALLSAAPTPTKEPPQPKQLQPAVATAALEAQHQPDVGERELPEGGGMQTEEPGHDAIDPRSAALDAAVCVTVEADCLNAAQAAAMQSAAAWLGPDAKLASPLVLIHGPFGSGKSTLLVSMVRFLRQQLQQVPADAPLRGARILVAAHTNTAVDRIMVGLLEAGYRDFLRIGSLKRMDKAVLPFSLHCCNSSKSTAIEELKDMLTAASSTAEAAIIEKELQEATAGAEKKRRYRLKSVPVIGATCCAMLLPILDNMRFDIVILDEATQVTEPLSLVALIRAHAKHVVIAGDPCQLGPILAFPQSVSAEGTTSRPSAKGGGSEAASALRGLARPMFQRLQALGHATVLLRHQFRCHPSLSRIPNALFYGGRLLDGCSEERRAGLVAGLPPLTFVNVNGHCRQDNGHSSSNMAEAQAVARLVRQLTAAGVDASAVGIICFFTAQVKAVQNQLELSAAACLRTESQAPSDGATPGDFFPQVATVDSFQGQEKDVIILTTVVTGGSAAFAGDAARLNVALTRARRHLVVVGFAEALHAAGPAFSRILDACRRAPGAFWPYGQVQINMRRAEGKENHAPGTDTGGCPAGLV